MSNPSELHEFLAGLTGTGPRATRIPPALYRIASGVVRNAREDVSDLVSDVVLELLERKGQAGGVEHLLLLDEAALVRALRRRALQARATQIGGRWRLVKSLRAHVQAALEQDLSAIESLPISLMVGERLSARAIAEATAYLLAQADAPQRSTRTIAGRLLDLYFSERVAGADERPHVEQGDEATAVSLDAARHAAALRSDLGPDLLNIVIGRARGLTLAEAGRGRIAASTAHDRLRMAVAKIKDYARTCGMVREELEAAFTCCCSCS